MPRRTRARNISRRISRRIKTRKNRRTKLRYRRGGNGEKVKCSMCGKMVNKEDTFIPRECLVKHGPKAAHRICKDCWWDPKKGFALENSSHKCPGCLKGLPLKQYDDERATVIDLTED
jgi:hypothetical protein